MRSRKSKFVVIVMLILIYEGFSHFAFAGLFPNEDQSFAQQYGKLAELLMEVKDRDTALMFKPAIQEQIEFLQANQISGEKAFSQMSEEEQTLFVKRFQNNRYHCGGVTQVMQERQRILLNPEMANVLGDLLEQIPN